MPAVTQTGTRSPLRAATRSGRIAPASPSNHPRALLAAQSVDGLQSVGGLGTGTRPSGRSGSLSPSGRPLLGGDGLNGRGAEVRPTPAPPMQFPDPAVVARKPQKREAAERVQILYLRQEVAQLRRQNVELQNQVRAGDLQVENLSGLVKDLQENICVTRIGQRKVHPSASDVFFTPKHADNATAVASNGPRSGPYATRQDSQRSRTTSASTSTAAPGQPGALPLQAGPSSGASTPVVAMPVVGSPTSVNSAGQPLAQPIAEAQARTYGQRRLSMDGQSGVIVASRTSAVNQAQRYARQAEAGERGSASRPSSAFQRHKEQMASNRRIIVAAPTQAAPKKH
eukprot:g18234.t1